MASLEEGLTYSRTDEMSKWGRTHIYRRMRNLLGKQRGTALDLVNHGLAMVDDELDSSADSIEELKHFRELFRQSFSGARATTSTPTEQAVVDLGYTLHELASAPFLHFTDRAIGKHIFEDVLKFWDVEERNFQRKGKILDKKTLDEITLEIGAEVGSQFLYILDYPRVYNEFTQLARTYGLAVKLADNLCDFREDIQRGFVNIPQEDIHHVIGISVEGNRVVQINPNKLALSLEYIEKEYKRVEQAFASADRLMLVARARRPIWSRKLDERLCLFGQFCNSWLDQAKYFMAIETLRSYDIASHSTIPFLSADELREIEQRYGVRIGDIIHNSYRQESRNTRLVRDAHPSYNPYSHDKISVADERIRALVQEHPEIREVLDFGCDDGERTAGLYGRRRLHGIELTETAVDAEKRGIRVYRGSMTDDVYRDKANPNGKQFDLVSIVGEMVNFVGLDTDTMLARAVEQTRNDGYLLVTAMHPEAEQSQEGKYVVWSHTKSTWGKWLLEEAKIPRKFLFLSEQGLQQRLDKVAQGLGYKLSPQGSSRVYNYYEDMPLGIYLFRKDK